MRRGDGNKNQEIGLIESMKVEIRNTKVEILKNEGGRIEPGDGNQETGMF